MKALLLLLVFALLLAASAWLFYLSLSRGANERVMLRLAHNQLQPVTENLGWAPVNRAFLQAGLPSPAGRLTLWLSLWLPLLLCGFLIYNWIGVALALLVPPIVLRLFIAWRYHKRVKRMIDQLPQLLDHTVRSLKSGRTLSDAVLHGIDATSQPLKDGMSRIQRNVQLGVCLPDAAQDFADLYECDEFHLFALGLRVNHRYGGNASELMENLIRLIREREQASRQLRAMTGETRMTALVLAGLPIAMASYFLAVNPNYLMHMWDDSDGKTLLMAAFTLQALGCLALWRMMRSV